MLKNDKSLVAVREREREREKYLHFNERSGKIVLNSVVEKVIELVEYINRIKSANILIEIARLNL